jgi:uncharacterized membrane protein YhiD involved in acid resistance
MVVNCAINTLIGGVLAIYISELYNRCSTTVSNRDTFSGVFPMLTMVTVVIIFVVKSSLALSLGLVGALSIVRFRAAIKSPEELVYLFFCIAVGLALGAEHRLLALVAVAMVSVFIVGRRYFARHPRHHNLLLTLTGDADGFFRDNDSAFMEALESLTHGMTIQRFDLEDGHVQFRANVSVSTPEETTRLMSNLREKFPSYQLSYVNLDTLL